jgi:uroporphyrin-III C-methyltransferase
VGAGPGGLDTLTVKALRLLRECDAVVYDDLGGGEADILAEIPTTAERVFVGKRGGDERSWRQDDINATLVRLSVEDGKTTVRLKGGCPSVFGRTSQEMRALRAAGVSFELVPGVSSALAGPLAASIPLTEKLVGKHFAVASAHDCDALDFETAFRGIDTCVFLMAGKSVPTLCERLVNESGKKKDTPVVIVRWACTDREEIVVGTLGDVALETAGRELSPCVFVAGEVCAEAAAERLSGNANFERE